jgi:predicted small metal-binding protein
MGVGWLDLDEKMKFKCKDIGMKCDFEVKGAGSRDEVAEIAGVHARRVHNITSMTPDLEQKMNAAIKN